MGDPAARRRARVDPWLRLDGSQLAHRPLDPLGVLGVDRRSRARGRGGGERGPRRVRRHGERAHRADVDEHVLRSLHADLLPRPGLQGGARSLDRHVHVLVHAHAERRGERRPGLGGDVGGGVPRSGDPDVRGLPGPGDPPAAAGRRRRARRSGGAESTARGTRGGCPRRTLPRWCRRRSALPAIRCASFA